MGGSLLRASLFITCIADNFFPKVGDSVVKILRKNGVDLDFPKEPLMQATGMRPRI